MNRRAKSGVPDRLLQRFSSGFFHNSTTKRHTPPLFNLYRRTTPLPAYADFSRWPVFFLHGFWFSTFCPVTLQRED
jgi:hypothetical protein